MTKRKSPKAKKQEKSLYSYSGAQLYKVFVNKEAHDAHCENPPHDSQGDICFEIFSTKLVDYSDLERYEAEIIGLYMEHVDEDGSSEYVLEHVIRPMRVRSMAMFHDETYIYMMVAFSTPDKSEGLAKELVMMEAIAMKFIDKAIQVRAQQDC